MRYFPFEHFMRDAWTSLVISVLSLLMWCFYCAQVFRILYGQKGRLHLSSFLCALMLRAQ